ncbi:phage integrase SAM-like domain-containing protein [Mucilaginibacter sp. UR6-11]|uniref:phage integrase SAM-like domain-containing protein n=1 Tax=Mucilaginibacter sp. UR6-11 TaxID=1435644 RepID=UPI001E46E91B|nr:phage integrase SAM-like domain-containing protein [Mucilaginibacter sp. UR6-11]MCC8427308.1 site-specific integrase [Mucilaginibacter sp. UR6-11]
MATFKAVINKEAGKQDGTWRVRIRVTHLRVIKYISTEYFVTKKQLNKDFKIKDRELLDIIDTTLIGYREKIAKLSTNINSYTCEKLKEYLLNNIEANSDVETKIDYIVFSNLFISKIKVKGTRENGFTTLNSFIDFVGPSIDINDISLSLIKKYEDFLRSSRSAIRSNNPGKTVTLLLKPLTDTGIRDYMAKLKFYYTTAMKVYNERQHILIPYNPFDNYEPPYIGETENKILSISEMESIIDCSGLEIITRNKVTRSILSRDAFLLSFYLIGMNAVDLYNVDEYDNGRITYSRAKTKSRRKDNALISIKVEPEAIPLIEKYRDPTGKRVFCFYQMYTHFDGLTAAINTGLKTVAKHLNLGPDLTFYYARYSWANIARNHCRVSKDDVAMAINHADAVHKTTDIYLQKDWRHIDEANRKVLNVFKPRNLKDWEQFIPDAEDMNG